MTVPDSKEKWSGQVTTVTLGSTADNGGTRGRTVTIGGAAGIPFLNIDAPTPNAPVIAMDVFDVEPVDWPAPASGRPRRDGFRRAGG